MPVTTRKVCLFTLLVAPLLVGRTLGSQASGEAHSSAKEALLHSDLQGGRHSLLSLENRSSFLGKAYQEAIVAAINEKQKARYGRRLMQASDPIATCGLTNLVTAAATAGVSLQALTNLFLAILLQVDVAASPAGFGFGNLPFGNPAACNLVRIRLQALIATQTAGAGATAGLNGQAGLG